MSPMFSPIMHSAILDPAAVMRGWKLGDSSMSSVNENCEVDSGEGELFKLYLWT